MSQHTTPPYNQNSLHTGLNSNASGTSLSSRPMLNIGILGAIIGGAVAAAQVIPKVTDQQYDSGQAVGEVLREAAGAGVATAAGAGVAGAVNLGGFVSLVTLFGAATGVKYLWNTAFGPDAPVVLPAEAPEKTPAPAKGRKTPAKK